MADHYSHFPPVFVWADFRRLTGTWCMVATIYHETTDHYIGMTDLMKVGMIPLTAMCSQDRR